MSGQVKYLDDTQIGAPVLSGQVNALIDILDAVLVNGFNTNTLDSLSVSSDVATATRAAGHNYRLGDVVLIAGATPTGLNGDKKVTGVTTTTFTFATSGVADGAATGTITAKVAPLGWEKTYSGTNLAAYRSLSVQATGFYLRVDDTDTRSARVVAYESMTDVDTGVDPFPTATQFSGGLYWHKSNDISSTPRKWWLVGDDDRFILGLNYFDPNDNAEVGSGSAVHFFGDFSSYRSGDAYNCALVGSPNSSITSSFILNSYSSIVRSQQSAGCYMARDVGQIDKSAEWYPNNVAPNSSLGTAILSGDSSYEAEYPSPTDGGLLFSDILITEQLASAKTIRGVVPGGYWVPQNQPASHGTLIDGSPGLPGREILIIETGHPSSATIHGRLAIDVTGPWD